MIVPTYCSGDGLDRVVRSLDRQTMPQHEFEVIFVDDGSPDDTFSRLEQLRKSRRNVRTAQIENSGWPSRPRNLGIEMALGEYVLFMDHDDELGPDGLRAAYEFGHINRADAVHGREWRALGPPRAVETFRMNVDNVIGVTDVIPLKPMTPHKLYRRQLLLDHAIRFPEGGRVMWEDIYFNVQVIRHAQVVSVLAETPFYHWVVTGANNSSRYGRNVDEYWEALRSVLQFITEQLADERHRAVREQMVLAQFRARGLQHFLKRLKRGNEDELGGYLQHFTQILHTYIPLAFDSRLSKADQAYLHLIRAGRLDAVDELAGFGFQNSDSRLTGVRLERENLRLTMETTWRDARGQPLALRMIEKRIVRDMPASLSKLLPAALLDVTEEVHAASSEFALKRLDDGTFWLLPTQSEVLTTPHSGGLAIVIRSTADIDLSAAIFGRPIESGSCRVVARNSMVGRLRHRGVSTGIRPVASVHRGDRYIIHADADGHLRLTVVPLFLAVQESLRRRSAAAVRRIFRTARSE